MLPIFSSIGTINIWGNGTGSASFYCGSRNTDEYEIRKTTPDACMLMHDDQKKTNPAFKYWGSCILYMSTGFKLADNYPAPKIIRNCSAADPDNAVVFLISFSRRHASHHRPFISQICPIPVSPRHSYWFQARCIPSVQPTSQVRSFFPSQTSDTATGTDFRNKLPSLS